MNVSIEIKKEEKKQQSSLRANEHKLELYKRAANHLTFSVMEIMESRTDLEVAKYNL